MRSCFFLVAREQEAEGDECFSERRMTFMGECTLGKTRMKKISSTKVYQPEIYNLLFVWVFLQLGGFQMGGGGCWAAHCSGRLDLGGRGWLVGGGVVCGRWGWPVGRALALVMA